MVPHPINNNSQCRIRNRYLSKLGIFPPVATNKKKTSKEVNLPLPKQQWRTESRTPTRHERRTPTRAGSRGPLVEEIPELSLKGLAFLESMESISSFTASVGDDVCSLYDDDDDDEIFAAAANDDSDDDCMIEEQELEASSFLPPPPTKVQSTNRVVQFHNAVAVYEIPSHRDYDDVSHKSMWTSLQVQEQNAIRNSIEFMADQRDWRNACEEVDMIQTKRGELIHPATWRFVCAQVAAAHLQLKKMQQEEAAARYHAALRMQQEAAALKMQQQEATPRSRRTTASPRKKCVPRITKNQEERQRRFAIIGNAPSLTRFADT